jgi:hypothetical protein
MKLDGPISGVFLDDHSAQIGNTQPHGGAFDSNPEHPGLKTDAVGISILRHRHAVRSGFGEHCPGGVLRQFIVHTDPYPEHVVSQRCDSHYSAPALDFDPIVQRFTTGHTSENNQIMAWGQRNC